MKIYLSPELEEFIAEQIESGVYQSASEVIRDALELFRQQEEFRKQRLEEVRRDIQAGLDQADRGELAPLDIEAIKVEGRRRLEEERKTR